MNEAIFNITKISYPVLGFLFNPKYKDDLYEILHLDNGGNVGVNLKGEISIHDKSTLYCLLDVTVSFHHEKYSDIARINVQLLGEFTSPSGWEEEVVNSFHANYYSILFPFMRETIYYISSKNDFTFLIEPINFIETIKKNPTLFRIDLSAIK